MTGEFQSKAAQFGCISCDSLGHYYQEESNSTSCDACPLNTQRAVGSVGNNRTSCRCKEGTWRHHAEQHDNVQHDRRHAVHDTPSHESTYGSPVACCGVLYGSLRR
jgi:hypothetical protein